MQYLIGMSTQQRSRRTKPWSNPFKSGCNFSVYVATDALSVEGFEYRIVEPNARIVIEQLLHTRILAP